MVSYVIFWFFIGCKSRCFLNFIQFGTKILFSLLFQMSAVCLECEKSVQKCDAEVNIFRTARIVIRILLSRW